MAYIKESLSNNESVNEIYELHWFSKIPMIICILFSVPTTGMAIIALSGSPELVGIGNLFGGLSLFFIIGAIYEFLKNRSLENGTTNKRVIHKRGIISRKTEEMKIGSIETVEINQGVLGRIFGFGNVKITGQGVSDVLFSKIDNPMKVKKSIENI